VPVPFSALITSLAQNTTYHYRAKIFDGSGFIYGPDKTFTTRVPIPPSVINVLVNYSAGNDFCTFSASINANSFSTNASVQYCLASDNFSAPSMQMTPTNVAGTTATPVSYLATGLQLNQQYKYRVIATNAWGSDTSAVQTFATASPVSISSGPTTSTIQVYPNPATAYLIIDAGNLLSNISITVSNAMGEKVSAPISRVNNQYRVNTSLLASGNYWLYIGNENRSYTTAFLKR
jgi:hypothetical protein